MNSKDKMNAFNHSLRDKGLVPVKIWLPKEDSREWLEKVVKRRNGYYKSRKSK